SAARPRTGVRLRPPTVSTLVQESGRVGRGWQWVVALLPAFPIVLLVLRLWLLGRQDLHTMLLLVQHISPLGLASALVITLVWVPPVVVLTGRFLGALLVVSQPNPTVLARSWLAGRVDRIPDWVVVLFVVWAAFTWQLRFLPTLLMLALATAGLVIRQRHPRHRRLVRVSGLWLPLAGAVAAYLLLWPAIADAREGGDWATAALLVVPPALTVLLTGPLPRATARVVTQWLATTAAFLAPFVVGGFFLATPILPAVAVEVVAPSGTVDVIRGNVVAVDDRMTTLIDGAGTIRFVPNDTIRSKVLCPGADHIPSTPTQLRSWGVESTALEFLAPPVVTPAADPRCLGRPLD
ncbi:MAG TPA: hypothetical protein VGD67_10185, partial [Pseudonocardiaceae bacterium]